MVWRFIHRKGRYLVGVLVWYSMVNVVYPQKTYVLCWYVGKMILERQYTVIMFQLNYGTSNTLLIRVLSQLTPKCFTLIHLRYHHIFTYMDRQQEVFNISKPLLSFEFDDVWTEDLIRKKVFFPEFQISLLEWLGVVSQNWSIGPTGTQQENGSVWRHAVSPGYGDRFQGESVVLGGQPQKHDRERPVQRKQQTNHRLPRRRQILWSCSIRGTISPNQFNFLFLGQLKLQAFLQFTWIFCKEDWMVWPFLDYR